MPHSEEKPIISRRNALKHLAAMTGAATLAALPTQWEKPIIEVGTLPAHAQTSLVTLLTLEVNYSLQGDINNCTNSSGAGTAYDLEINYQDTGGNVSDASILEVISIFNPGGSSFSLYSGSLSGWPGSRSGDANTGILSVGLCTGFGNSTSNTLSATLTLPLTAP